MLLYIIYNADLLEIADTENKEDALGYVDDIAMLAVGKDFKETTSKLEKLMTKMDRGITWSKDHNSRFEISKSVVMHASRRTQVDPRNARKRIPLDQPPLQINGQLIQKVANFKYLGVLLDEGLQWKAQAQKATANATSWILQFRRLTKPSTGVSAKLMRQLYIAVAIPKMTYGVEVWYSPPIKPTGAARNAGSVGALRGLQKAHRMATLAINGALRTTPLDLLDAHAGTLPIELTLLKTCHRATIRLCTVPQTHPLHQVVRSAASKRATKHLGPIDQLIARFQIVPDEFEIIQPACEDTRHNSLCTEVAATRESAIEMEKKDNADFKVFSDGSGNVGETGAAAVLYRKGCNSPLKSFQKYIGPVQKHNTFEAEAIGGILAMWLLKCTPETHGKMVSFYTDNQSLIRSLHRPKATSGQHLVKNLIDAAKEVNGRLKIRWISGHSNVPGNKKADELAGKAAEGNSSRQRDLLAKLQVPIPSSASAVKQSYHEHLLDKWKDIWAESPRKPRFTEEIDDNFPFNKYRKLHNGLTRGQASIIMQVRCGHIPLNAYLHRIGKSETRTCQNCSNGQDEAPETVKHFIFECPAYTEQRRTMEHAIGEEHNNLKGIMQDVKKMKALTAYINQTGRFKTEREVRNQLNNPPQTENPHQTENPPQTENSPNMTPPNRTENNPTND
jgi:ribonuclease HI